MSLSKLPVVPLDRIIGLLDKQSRVNLVIAAKNSQLDLTLRKMSKKRTFVCPYCVNDSGTHNMMQLVNGKENETQAYKNGYLACIRRFNFFSQFRFTESGNSNYERARPNPADINSRLQIRKCSRNIEDYDKILYFGIYHWREELASSWKRNYVNLLLNFGADAACKDGIEERLNNLFFGGNFDGFRANSRLAAYDREELLKHIKEEHFSDRVHEARIKNRTDWYKKLMNAPLDIPHNFYSDNLFLDVMELESFLMDTVVARYLGSDRNDAEMIANGLLHGKQIFWTEIKFIYKLIITTFEELRYPCRPLSHDDISLFKMYDLINQTLDIVI